MNLEKEICFSDIKFIPFSMEQAEIQIAHALQIIKEYENCNAIDITFFKMCIETLLNGCNLCEDESDKLHRSYMLLVVNTFLP